MDLDGDLAASPPVPPHVAVWRSVRVHGETKTERSRRTPGLPQMAVEALRELRDSQADERLLAADGWQDTRLVFTAHLGTVLDARNIQKMFKRVCTTAGIGNGWASRELRTSFVSLLSHDGVGIEEIACIVGHASTRTTRAVYRRELRPVITTGAEIIDEYSVRVELRDLVTLTPISKESSGQRGRVSWRPPPSMYRVQSGHGFLSQVRLSG